MKKFDSKKLPVLIVHCIIIFSFCLALLIGLCRLDPDYGWHLFLGQKIAENKMLPNHFIGYNYFENIRIVDHEWLSNWLMFESFKHVGNWLLFLVSALILGLAYYFVLKGAEKKTSSNIAAVSIALLVFVSSAPLIGGIRIQYLILLFAAILVYVGMNIKSAGTRFSIYLIVFIIGMNLTAATITLAAIPLLLEFDNFSKKILKKELLICSIIILSLALTPNGTRFWELIRDYIGDSSYKNNIEEWLSIFSFPINSLECLVPLAISIFLFTVNKYYRKIALQHRALILFYLIAGIRYQRYLPIFMIVASPFLANSIVDLHQKIEGLITIKISKISIFFTIMLALFITVSWHDIISLPSKIRHPFKNPEYPVQAAEYLRNTGSDNIFNSYGWGGYLIWTNQPQRVFIDGRGPQAKIGDSTLLNEYLNLMRGKIPEKLDEYKINTVLLDNKVSKYNYLNRVLARVMKIDINTTRGEKLKKVLESSSDWEKTYEDGISTIYSRKK